MEKPDRSVYTPQDFIEWQASGSLELTPKFQRRGVWTTAARSFFIDSILRGMPVPPIYIRLTQSPTKKKLVRQVIDGQQRVSTIVDFIEDKFRLAKVFHDWGGKTFSELDKIDKETLINYGFSTELFKGISDNEVLEIFARLNTYSVPLNAQELRNGKFFGLFKQLSYSLAYEHLEFWRRQKIFTERNIARMLEVELTSELMIAQIGGMQDKKKSIDSYYSEYDEKFEQKKTVEKRFRTVVDVVNESFEEGLGETEFSRSPLFYTLFCSIYHRQFGLPGTNLPTPKRRLTSDEKLALAEAAQKLSEFIAFGRADEPVPQKYDSFVAACLRQTDNIRPREIRLRTLYSRAFN